MASGKVSAAFNAAFAKTSGVEDAKKAEVQMMNSITVPVGWSGKCKVIDMVADVSKKGNMYVNMVLVPLKGDYVGKKQTKNWTFNDSSYKNDQTGVTTSSSAADKMERFLNDMEVAGMPRELRMGFDTIEDIINWWLDPDHDREVNCEYVAGSGTAKYFNFKRPDVAVDNSTSMAPTSGLPQKKSDGATFTVGSNIGWNEVKYIVEEVLGDTVTVKSALTGKIKTVPKSECTLI